MKKFLFTLSAFLIFLLNVAFVDASGVVHVKAGETFMINVKSMTNASNYQWILKDSSGQILQKEVSQSFEYNFVDTGTYLLNLSADIRDGSTKTTSIDVLVTGEGLVTSNIGNSLRAELETLPQKSEQGVVELEGDKGDVYFIANSSVGEIKEYQIDLNLAEDSNHDGDPTNDVDNKGHTSLSDGTAFKKTFNRNDGAVEVGLTVIDKYGKKDTDTVKITFVGDDVIQLGELEARISSFPSANEKGVIYLYDNENKVTFYTGASVGDIVEYRIDKNIKIDSDGDGDPANDVDNKNDNSFYSGDMWTTEYNKDWGNSVMQLTVVDKNGQGSRIQRKIVFEDSPANIEIILDNPDLEAVGKLIVDKSEISAGDAVNFAVFPAPENATFEWDFDGDSIVDTKGTESVIAYLYESAGDFNATVNVLTEGNDPITYARTITVHTVEGDDATQPPIAEFTYFIDKNVITFSNASEVDSQLPNTDYIALWDFGNGEISSEKSPIYEYKQHGRFRVVLTVTDIAEKTSKKVEIIEIPLIEGLTDAEGGMSEGEVVENGVIIQENGTKIYPDGTQILIDGTTIEPDGTEIKPDGTKIRPDGSLVGADGTITLPDGTVIGADGKEIAEETVSEGRLGTWFWVLIVILAVFLLPVIYLLVEKIRNPALTFEEIIEGLKEKFSKKSHISEEPIIPAMEAEEQVITGEIVDNNEQQEEDENQEEKVVAQAETETTENEPAPLDVQDGEMPDWLKNADESVDALGANLSSTEEEDNSVPDWLEEENEEVSNDEAEKSNFEEENKDEFILPQKEATETPEQEEETKNQPEYQTEIETEPETEDVAEPASRQEDDQSSYDQDHVDIFDDEQDLNEPTEEIDLEQGLKETAQDQPTDEEIQDDNQSSDQITPEIESQLSQDLPDWLKDSTQDISSFSDEHELADLEDEDVADQTEETKLDSKEEQVQAEPVTDEEEDQPIENLAVSQAEPDYDKKDDFSEEEGEISEEPQGEVIIANNDDSNSQQSDEEKSSADEEESDWQEIPPEDSNNQKTN